MNSLTSYFKQNKQTKSKIYQKENPLIDMKDSQIREKEDNKTDKKKLKQNKNNKDYKFQKTWLDLYVWLRFEQKPDDKEFKMYCQYCLNYKKELEKQTQIRSIKISSNTMNTFIVGTTRFKAGNIVEHQQTYFHKDAANFAKAKDMRPVNIFQQSLRDKLTYDELKPLFVAQYLICKTKVPFAIYEDIVNSYRFLNINCSTNYSSLTSGREIMEIIYSQIEESVLFEIKFKRYPISLSFDIKCNRSKEQQLGIGIKYPNSKYEPKEEFLKICEIKEKNAEGIFLEILEVLTKYDILQQIYFISTDGAVTMTSAKNGVFGKLKSELPWLQSLHCRAHLLNLGLTDCSQIHEILSDTNNLIFKLCSYFNSRRSNNIKILKEDQEQEYIQLLEAEKIDYQNQFKPKNLIMTIDIRWLSCLSSIKRIFQVFPNIITSLEKIKGIESQD